MKETSLRRLSFLILLTATLAWPARAQQTAPPMHVSEQRLRATLEKLSEFGRPPGGTFADGVTRLGFSAEDLAAREGGADVRGQ